MKGERFYHERLRLVGYARCDPVWGAPVKANSAVTYRLNPCLIVAFEITENQQEKVNHPVGSFIEVMITDLKRDPWDGYSQSEPEEQEGVGFESRKRRQEKKDITDIIGECLKEITLLVLDCGRLCSELSQKIADQLDSNDAAALKEMSEETIIKTTQVAFAQQVAQSLTHQRAKLMKELDDLEQTQEEPPTE